MTAKKRVSDEQAREFLIGLDIADVNASPKHDLLASLAADLLEAREQLAALRLALTKISEGRGRYSRDQFEHACNTVEDMKEIAINALAGKDNDYAQ